MRVSWSKVAQKNKFWRPLLETISCISQSEEKFLLSSISIDFILLEETDSSAIVRYAMVSVARFTSKTSTVHNSQCSKWSRFRNKQNEWIRLWNGIQCEWFINAVLPLFLHLSNEFMIFQLSKFIYRITMLLVTSSPNLN